MSVWIYLLRDPRDGEVRYIGRTLDPRARLVAHISSARNGCRYHSARWIAQLLRGGFEPSMELLLELPEDESWQEHERRLIAEYRARGARLTNITEGGDGVLFLDEADLLRRVERQRAAYDRPGMREQASRVARDINSRPAVKAAKSAGSKAMWEDPAKRAKLIKSFGSPETKAKQSQKKRAAWADPHVGARLRALHSSEETRRKKSEGAKRRATPEYRAMMAERTRAAWASGRRK